MPFSTSSDEDPANLGLLKRAFERPALVDSISSLTESGNCVLRGVMTVTTLRAERRIVSRIVHSRFLAKKKRVAVATVSQGSLVVYMEGS